MNDVGKGYKRLKKGDLLKRGDEFANSIGEGDWTKCPMRCKLDGTELCVYRRRVSKPVNFQRLALKLSKANNIAEVRAIYKRATAK